MATQASHAQPPFPSALNAPINETVDDAISHVADLRLKGELVEAERISRQLNVDVPDNFRIMHLLGMTLHQRGKHREAIYWLSRVARFTPESPEIGFALGESLLTLGRYEHAIKIFEKLAMEAPNSVVVQQGIAAAYHGMNDHISALAHARQAIELAPDDASLYDALAHMQIALGQPEAAITTYHQLLKRQPKNITAHHQICDATEHKHGIVDSSMQALMMILDGKDISDEDRIALHFSLGRAFDAIGDFKRAFEQFKRGNQLKRLSIRYAVEQDTQLFHKLKTQFTSELFARHAASATHDDSAVFLVGMPRSGMALVEQILASHPHIHGGGAMHHLHTVTTEPHAAMERHGFPDYVQHLSQEGVHALGMEYLIRRGNRAQRHYITDSYPYNFIYLGMAKLLLPNAKIIHCSRNPLDTCVSAYQQLFPHAHPFSYDLRELGEFYLAYEDLMAHWKAQMPEDSILTVSYEELIHNTQATVDKMLAFLGLDYDAQCLHFETTQRPAPLQTRRPLHTQSVEKWQHYSAHLTQLKQGLGLPCEDEPVVPSIHNKKRLSLATLKAVSGFGSYHLFRGTSEGNKH